jgi:hypothetical protein
MFKLADNNKFFGICKALIMTLSVTVAVSLSLITPASRVYAAPLNALLSSQVPFIPGMIAPPKPALATVPHQTTDWIPVPSWLAGTWEASSEVVLYSFDYRQQVNVVGEPASVKIDRVSTVGVQRDPRGTIWHYTGVPYRRSVEAGGYIEYQDMQDLKLLRCSDDELKVQCRANVSRRNRDNGEVFDSFREDTITTYSQLQDGLIEVNFMITDFDAQNKPIHAARTVCTERRIKPFIEVNNDERGNLREKFDSFMMNNQ